MKQLIVIIALLLLSLSAFAHPASDITAQYTAKSRTLSITFDHAVKDAAAHYIQGVQVRQGGITIISQVCTTQDTSLGGELLYKIPNLKKGDTLEIIMDCNKGGRKSIKMILN